MPKCQFLNLAVLLITVYIYILLMIVYHMMSVILVVQILTTSVFKFKLSSIEYKFVACLYCIPQSLAVHGRISVVLSPPSTEYSYEILYFISSYLLLANRACKSVLVCMLLC